MLFKVLILALLLYFTVKAVRSMMLAIRQDAGRLGSNGGQRPPEWQTPVPKRDRRDEEIEEARWEDLP